MKILYLAPWFPFPPDNGIRIRLYHLLRALGQHHDVTLIAFVRDGDRTESKELERICRRVHTVPWRKFNPTHAKALLGFFSARPRSMVDSYSVEMAYRVAALTQLEAFDAVIASTTDTAEYAVRASAPTRLLEDHNSMTRWMGDNYRSQKKMLPRARAWLTLQKSRQYESQLYARFDGCTMVSDLDARAVADWLHYKAPIRVVPNGVDLDYYVQNGFHPQQHAMVFNGSLTYAANFGAAQYFSSEIFPRIRQGAPDAYLQITGTNNGVARHSTLSQPGIVLTGYLEDIRPTVAQASVCVVPLQTGGGTRLKILEAMALGTPVVSTAKGAEGLDVTHGKDILIADAPAEFAEHVLEIFNNQALRARLSTNARHLVETKYDWKSIGAQFESFVRELVERSKN